MKTKPIEKRKLAAGHDGRRGHGEDNKGKMPPDPMAGKKTRPFLSRGEVSRLFGVSVSTVTRWARLGMLRALRTPGGHYRFPAEETRRAALSAATPATEAAATRPPEISR